MSTLSLSRTDFEWGPYRLPSQSPPLSRRVLSTPVRLIGASIGALFFGAAPLECVIRGRSKASLGPLLSGRKRRKTTTTVYGPQLTMGYLLMLIVMSFSGPLLLCVVLGLMGGHAVFNYRDLMNQKEKNSAPTEINKESASFSSCGERELQGQRERQGLLHSSRGEYALLPEFSLDCRQQCATCTVCDTYWRRS